VSLFLDLVFAAAVLAAAEPTTHAAAQAAPAPEADFATLGRGIDDVELVDDKGAKLRWAALKGRPRAVFFGFTRCPVICPVTVWEIDAALEKVGKDGESVQMNFVSLDPARDTPAAMNSYFTSFKARMRALTGSAANVARVAKAFDVVHKKVALNNGDYTLDHTAAVFLLDENGAVVDVMGYGTPQDTMVKRFKQLLGVKAE